jgi:hypothetical protein
MAADQVMATYIQINSRIGYETKAIDFAALDSVLKIASSPVNASFSHWALTYIQPCHKILGNPEEAFVIVMAADRESESYGLFDSEEHEREVSSDIEYERRHPGTNYDSDFDDSASSDSDRATYGSFSPCNTKATRCVSAIALAGPEGLSCELKSSYDFQLAVRMDDARKAILRIQAIYLSWSSEIATH